MVVLTKPVTASEDIATATVIFTITPQAGSGVTIPGIRILNSSTETATFYLDYKVDCYQKAPLKGDLLFLCIICNCGLKITIQYFKIVIRNG